MKIFKKIIISCFSFYFIKIFFTQYVIINKNNKEISNYSLEIENLKIQQKNLKKKLEKLSNDDFFIEETARERYNLVKSDEHIFKDNQKIKCKLEN